MCCLPYPSSIPRCNPTISDILLEIHRPHHTSDYALHLHHSSSISCCIRSSMKRSDSPEAILIFILLTPYSIRWFGDQLCLEHEFLLVLFIVIRSQMKFFRLCLSRGSSSVRISQGISDLSWRIQVIQTLGWQLTTKRIGTRSWGLATAIAPTVL
jgi:hypothetical protein